MRVKCSEDEESFLSTMYYFSWSIISYGSDGLKAILGFTVSQSKRGFTPFPVFSAASLGISVLMKM